VAKFKLKVQDRTVVLEGTDDEERPFKLTLDKVWTMNLVLELEDSLRDY
jgi:hypothetical protein